MPNFRFPQQQAQQGRQQPGQQDPTKSLADAAAALKASAAELSKAFAAFAQSGQGADQSAGKVNLLKETLVKGLVPGIELAGHAMRSVLDSLASGFGVAQNRLVQLAAAANPGAAVQLDWAFKSLSYTLGQIFQPLLQSATKFLQGLADWLYNLSPATKALVVGVGAVSVAVAALLPLVSVLTIAVAQLAAVTSVATAGISVAVGAVVAGLAALGLGVGAFAATSEELSGALDSLKEVLYELWDAVEPLIDEGFKALADVLRALAPLFREFANLLRDAWRSLGPFGPALAKLAAALGAAGLAGALLAVVTPLAMTVTFAATAVKLFSDLAKAIYEVVAASDALGQALRYGALGPNVAALAWLVKLTGDLGKELEANAAKERKRAPPGPADVRATTAEEFQRSLQRSALTASFAAGKPEDPARRAEAQRDALINRVEQTNRWLEQYARQHSEAAGAQGDAADTLGQIHAVVAAVLPGPLAAYLRRVGGQ